MFEAEFIHLRVHSSFSLAEGAILPMELAELCKKNHMPAVAVTDSRNLFCSLEFSLAASNMGVQPIIGCNMAVREEAGNINERESESMVALLAKDKQGYHNLLKLVAKSYMEMSDDAKPNISYADLKTYNAGLIALTGGLSGPLSGCLLRGNYDKAKQKLSQLKEIFEDRLYVELQRHGIAEQEKIEDDLIKLAYELEVPLVATNDVYFADEDMHEAHDALLCISDATFVDEENRRKKTKEHYFKSSRQMKELFKDLPEAIENTINIAKRCYVKSEEHKPMLPHYDCGEGRSEADELRVQAKDGLEQRLNKKFELENIAKDQQEEIKKEYFARLDFELDVIINMDFPGYFLIVSDFIKWSKDNDVPVGPGRGSGAGSVVAWSLQITDLDPIRFGLLFERFLNPERVSMPDFDVDFCQERRDLVIQYVQQKYGADKVAQIITFGKLQARAVLRDVGRVLQMPFGQIDRICKMIPFNPIDPVTLSKALSMDEMLREERRSDPEVGKLIGIALKLEGLNRHASTHAAGVVIADRPLDELIPLYRDPRSSMPVTGYSMKYAEKAGLVKFDFLGLKTLTVIAKACELIRQKGVEIDIDSIPLDDKDSFKMLSSGDSVGVFQLESAGMRDTLRKLKPDNLDDIIALISLYRPGPMDNIPSYIARKHGKEEPDYLHPMLEGVLKETYGVIIYQEQVMQIAQIMGGYSLGAADLLRRAMGKKIASEMDAQRELFVEGAKKNNVDVKQASSIFDLVAKFAGYGFNKSHAAAYALISYQTAYLKAKHPVEFLCALMNLEINDTDKLGFFIQEANSQNIEILIADVNKSGAYFKPEVKENGERAIRYGLAALKNVGLAAMKALQEEREKSGEFKDLFDFAGRLEGNFMNKKQLENLARAGAFDCISDNRKQIVEGVETLTRYSNLIREEKNSNQVSLFGDEMGIEIAKPKLPDVIDWKSNDRLSEEFEAVGFYLKEHPVAPYSDALRKMGVIFMQDFEEGLAHGYSSIKIAGVVTSKRIRSSAKGRFATVSLCDPSGIFEVSVFDEDLLSRCRDLIDNGQKLFINADARKDEGGVRIIAADIRELDDVMEKHNVNLDIYINDTACVENVKEIIGAEGKGRAAINIVLVTGGKEVKIKLPGKYNVTHNNFNEIAEIKGVSRLVEK